MVNRSKSIVWRIATGGALAMPLSWFAFANAFVNVTHFRSPAQALRMDPTDAVALSRQARAIFTQKGARAANDPEVVRLTQESLKGLALNGPALQLLGAASSASGLEARARRQLAYSDRLSRRDLGTQLWMIEDAVARNDVSDALEHYDVALRIEKDSQQLLFPVLTAALEDPRLWAPFLTYVREPAPWLGDFFRHAIRTSDRPDALAAIAIQAGGLPRNSEFDFLSSQLIRQLVEKDRFAEARRYYLTLDGADPQVLDELALTRLTTDDRYTPLTWQPYTMEGVDASIIASGGGAFEIHARVDSGVQMPVARKILQLKPGAYGFEAWQRTTSDTEGVSLVWSMSCLGPGSAKQLWSRGAKLGHDRMPVRGRIVVPADCPTQVAIAMAAGGSGQYGADITIESVRLNGI